MFKKSVSKAAVSKEAKRTLVRTLSLGAMRERSWWAFSTFCQCPGMRTGGCSASSGTWISDWLASRM